MRRDLKIGILVGGLLALVGAWYYIGRSAPDEPDNVRLTRGDVPLDKPDVPARNAAPIPANDRIVPGDLRRPAASPAGVDRFSDGAAADRTTTDSPDRVSAPRADISLGDPLDFPGRYLKQPSDGSGPAGAAPPGASLPRGEYTEEAPDTSGGDNPSAPGSLGSPTGGSPGSTGQRPVLSPGASPSRDVTLAPPLPPSAVDVVPVHAENRQYTVVQGDSLWDICKKVHGKATRDLVDQIAKANPQIANAAAIRAGQTLNIPSGVQPSGSVAGPAAPAAAASDRTEPSSPHATYVVAKGDGLFSIAERVLGKGARWREIYEINKSLLKDGPDDLKPGVVLKLPQR